MTSDALKQDIVHELDGLSPEALRDVRDFVASFEQGSRTEEEKGGLMEAAGCLSGEPLEAEQIEAALYLGRPF
jgi:hypothetical protein